MTRKEASAELMALMTRAPEFAVALDMAIEALEKQVPKKAVGKHYAHMRCPACNHRIPSGGGSSSRRRDNWCNYCGQAIDWDGGNGE